MCIDNLQQRWMFGCLNLEINKLVDCLYSFKNVFEKGQGKVECHCYPGPLRMSHLTAEHKQQLLESGHTIQSGEVPEARADHHLVYIEEWNSLLLLGGRALFKPNTNRPLEEYKNCSQNVYTLNMATKEWSVMTTDEETKFHLQRSQFGCVLNFPLVFITGGIRRGFDGQFEALNVDQLVILNLLTKCARVKKLVGLVTQHRLFAVNLSQRPKIMGTELLLFGGSSLEGDHLTSDNLKKSTHFFWISPDEDKILQVALQDYQADKAAIARTSVHWYNSSNAIIYGGTEPKKGHGGRSIFLLTTSPAMSQPICDAEKCIVDGKDPKMVTCTHCSLSLHIVCDLNLRKRRTLSVQKVIQ